MLSIPYLISVYDINWWQDRATLRDFALISGRQQRRDGSLPRRFTRQGQVGQDECRKQQP